MKSFQLEMHQQTEQTLTGRPRSGRETWTASLRAVSTDRLCDSDQNRGDYGIK